MRMINLKQLCTLFIRAIGESRSYPKRSYEFSPSKSELWIKDSGKIIEKIAVNAILPDSENLQGVRGYKSSGYNPLSGDIQSIPDNPVYNPKVEKSDKTVENEVMFLSYYERYNEKDCKAINFRTSYSNLSYNSVIWFESENRYCVYNDNVPIFLLNKDGIPVWNFDEKKRKMKQTI